MKKTAKTGTVTDEQGRVRFHGAFTGGFSAGYFNTVGSSEGFQPAQFVSSRSNRASQQNSRSIADYMDEGDGLLGGKLSSVAGIDSFARNDENIDHSALQSSNVRVLNAQLLSELTVQAKPSDTIGKKLLATMGWRLGQGIGPRISKKRVDYFSSNQKVGVTMEVHPGADLSKLPKSALLQNGSVTFAPDDEGQKIVFPPPKLDMYGLGFDVRMSGRLGGPSLESDYDVNPDDAYEGSSNTYRMSDVVKGSRPGGSGGGSAKINYSEGLRGKRGAVYGQQTQSAKRLKYTSGFAYNDEEDDVYSHDAPLALTNSVDVDGDETSLSLVAFDPEVGPEMLQNAQRRKEFETNAKETLLNINQGVDNWLGGGSSGIDGTKLSAFTASHTPEDLRYTLNAVERCPSDNRPPLAGFHVARRPRVVPPHYPPPTVPENFRAQHSFAEDTGEITGAAANTTTRVGRRQNPLDAAKERSEKMSDKVPESSTQSSGAVASSANSATDAPTEAKKASIFDLIKPEARLKLQNAINAVNPTSQVQIALPAVAPPLPPLPPTPPPPLEPSSIANSNATSHPSFSSTVSNSSTATTAAKDLSAPPARPMLTSSHLLNSTFAGLSQAFKNRFASATTSEGAGTKDSIVVEGMATASQYTQKLAEKAQLQAAEASATAKSAPKAIIRKGSTRTVTPWAPAPLLCKRMNVRLPDISKTSGITGMAEGQTNADVVSQLLGTHIQKDAPVLQFGRGQDTTSAELQREREEARLAEAAKLDVYQAPREDKPDISVFKSIFEDSDDEDDEKNEQEEEDTQNSNESSGEIGAKAIEEKKISTSNVNATSAPVGVAPAPPVASEDTEESGPVRFVPSKHRTTIANRSTGAINTRGAGRSRTSFEDPDAEQGGDIVLTRQVRPRLNTSEYTTESNKSESKKLTQDDDQSEEETVFVAVGGASSRAASQNTVSFGGGRARKSRTAAMGSLREKLLAQQREEDGDGDYEVKSAKREEKPNGAGAGVNRAVTTSAKVSARQEAKEVSEIINSEKISDHTSSPSRDFSRAASMQTNINASAADEFLADLSNILPTPPILPHPAGDFGSSSHHTQLPSGSESEQLREGPLTSTAPRMNSRFGPTSQAFPATVTVSAATSEVPAAANYFVPLPPPPPPLPLLPPQPVPPAPSAPSAPSAPHAPFGVPARASIPHRPGPEAVLPPEAKFESSIQRLQNSLLNNNDSKAHKESKTKKESKKSHKAHTSDRHKHKKDRKDRKRDKKDAKESKKSKKNRRNDNLESESDSSDNSSSDSE